MIDEVKRMLNKLKLKHKIKSVKALGTGESNYNYLVKIKNNQTFILRIKKNKSTVKQEFYILKSLKRLKIAPQVFYHGRDYIILEYTPGTAFKEDYHLNDKEFTILAEEVKKLHLLKITKKTIPKSKFNFQEYTKSFKGRLISLKKHVPAKTIARLDSARLKIEKIIKTKNFKEKYSLVHGDIAPQNIVRKKDNFRLIDWEEAGLGDPCYDIAFIVDEVSFPITKKQKRLFITAYLKSNNIPDFKARINLWQTLIRFEQLLWAIEHYFKNNDKTRVLEYLKTTMIKFNKLKIGEIWQTKNLLSHLTR